MNRSAFCAALAASALLAVASSTVAASEPQARELTLQRESERRLVGTLLVPASPTVREPLLIVAGSGPTDRDGNSALGLAAATYRLLAEALAAQGITTLRTDKRGIGASRTALAREEDSTLQLAAEDTRAWMRQLRETVDARCVWLLGHSEGALVALQAARDPAGVCGLILVAGLGRPAADVLREQLRANPANQPILDQALKAIDELEAGRRVDATGMHPALLGLFRPSVQPHMMSLFAADPVRLLRGYAGPVLVLQGTTDLQTSVADAERLAQARPGVELALFEGVNHVLKRAPAERAANLAAYKDPALPLAPGIADRIAAFVRQPAAGATAGHESAVTAPR
jgi:pimeloyl-ACP methyl ester carboxylesterase